MRPSQCPEGTKVIDTENVLRSRSFWYCQTVEGKGTKARGKNKLPRGDFAGRRPPKETDEEAYSAWQHRKEGYESTLRDIRAAYPGKTLKMPSANQMKYWDFMRDYMKEHCPKGTLRAETRAAMSRGAGAYKAALLKEAAQNSNKDDKFD